MRHKGINSSFTSKPTYTVLELFDVAAEHIPHNLAFVNSWGLCSTIFTTAGNSVLCSCPIALPLTAPLLIYPPGAVICLAARHHPGGWSSGVVAPPLSPLSFSISSAHLCGVWSGNLTSEACHLAEVPDKWVSVPLQSIHFQTVLMTCP